MGLSWVNARITLGRAVLRTLVLVVLMMVPSSRLRRGGWRLRWFLLLRLLLHLHLVMGMEMGMGMEMEMEVSHNCTCTCTVKNWLLFAIAYLALVMNFSTESLFQRIQ